MRVVFIRKRILFCLLLGLLFSIVGGVVIFHPLTARQTLGAPTEEAVALPIIMYHSVLEKQSACGPYVISPDTFESDLRYLQEHDYTSVFIQDLVAYTVWGQALPPKPVLITFDDGNLNNLTYILPLLQEYNMKAVISVVGEYIQQSTDAGDHNPAYSYLTWEEINEFVASGYVEIGNHTYALHNTGRRNGCLPMQNEPLEQYQAMLKADLQQLQDKLLEHCGIRPIVFAYPFGFVDEASFTVIKELGFQASLSCNEGMNYITHNPESLFCLKRYNRPHGISTATFMKRVMEE